MNTLSGKTALVTGATSGLGLEASVKLAALGADVVMVARNEEKGRAAVEDVKRRGNSPRVSLLLCDFSKQADVRALASAFRGQHARLDLLINNAGALSAKRQVTVDGLEQTFAVNHLGYFLLTNLLLDRLEQSAPARVVNVTSVGHTYKKVSMDFDNLQFERGGYDMLVSYARSKLANVLFTRELASRLASKGVTVNCLNPGAVSTNIWDASAWHAKPFIAIYKLFMITAAEGADRIMYLAMSPDVAGATGGYYDKDTLVAPSALGQDDALARQLWHVSAQLVGLEPRAGTRASAEVEAPGLTARSAE